MFTQHVTGLHTRRVVTLLDDAACMWGKGVRHEGEGRRFLPAICSSVSWSAFVEEKRKKGSVMIKHCKTFASLHSSPPATAQRCSPCSGELDYGTPGPCGSSPHMDQQEDRTQCTADWIAAPLQSGSDYSEDSSWGDWGGGGVAL